MNPLEPSVKDSLEEALCAWRKEPVRFLEDVLDWSPWTKQVEVAESVRDNFYTIVASGNGVGKTALIARLAIWYFVTHYPEAIVVTTAPTGKQVRDGMWAEIRSALIRAEQHTGLSFSDGLSPEANRLVLAPKKKIVGFTAKDQHAFNGLHAGHVAVFLDEAAGLGQHIFNGARSLAVSPDDRIVAVGNPLCGLDEPFARLWHKQDNSGQHKSIRISSLEYVESCEQGLVTYVPGMASRQLVDGYAGDYGEHSPQYKAFVLGEFDDGADHSLITQSSIELALARHEQMLEGEHDVADEHKACRLGIDVARGGDDSTRIVVIRNGLLIEPHHGIMRNAEGPQVARRALDIAEEYNATTIALDMAGVGSSPYDSLVEMVRSEKDSEVIKALQVYGNNFGAGATSNRRHANRRAELWDAMRSWLRNVGMISARDPGLFRELTSARFGYDPRSALLLEKKDKIRKRIGVSPDRADAIALAIHGHKGRKSSSNEQHLMWW